MYIYVYIYIYIYIYIYNTNLVRNIVKGYYEMDSSCKALTNCPQNPPSISEFF